MVFFSWTTQGYNNRLRLPHSRHHKRLCAGKVNTPNTLPPAPPTPPAKPTNQTRTTRPACPPRPPHLDDRVLLKAVHLGEELHEDALHLAVRARLRVKARRGDRIHLRFFFWGGGGGGGAGEREVMCVCYVCVGAVIVVAWRHRKGRRCGKHGSKRATSKSRASNGVRSAPLDHPPTHHHHHTAYLHAYCSMPTQKRKYRSEIHRFPSFLSAAEVGRSVKRRHSPPPSPHPQR